MKNATQEFVPIDDVRDGIVILKDGSMRGILMASSINFALKSDDERQAILLQFQDFLNSLDFSIQYWLNLDDSISGLILPCSKGDTKSKQTT